jgi:hypothetical protein
MSCNGYCFPPVPKGGWKLSFTLRPSVRPSVPTCVKSFFFFCVVLVYILLETCLVPKMATTLWWHYLLFISLVPKMATTLWWRYLHLSCCIAELSSFLIDIDKVSNV